MMATFDVLQRAAASGANLIITHEPTFYNHLDNFTEIPQKENDPVLAEKLAFIKEHHLVVWRFHDHWHRRTPDGIEAGMTHALGWEAFQDKQNQYLFTIPETTLDKLAAVLKTRLELHTMRVVGDPQMKITRVALSPGSAGMQREIGALEKSRYSAAHHRRISRMGNRGVRRRRRQRKEKQGADYSGPHPLRTSRNGRMHPLAQNFCLRSPGKFRARRATVLVINGWPTAR